MLKNLAHAEELSAIYQIPKEDILMIALNICGVKTDETKDKRTRFSFQLKGKPEKFYLAICVNTGETPFSMIGDSIYLNDEEIGTVIDREVDTCDSTYFRRNKTAMTLNSNSRSKCRGCKFCGTYSQEADDTENLTTEEKLSKYIDNLLIAENMKDLSSIIDVGICTGCFPLDDLAADHIIMVRKVLSKYGFTGSIKYIGSQIKTGENLQRIHDSAMPFSLYITAECFERRSDLLRPVKAALTIEKMQEVLGKAKGLNMETSFLYILGLDSLETIDKGFRLLAPQLTRFPVINLFQNYISDQESLRHSDAKELDYYLKARKLIENIFITTTIRPKIWEDYRGLWYYKFGMEDVNDYKI